EIGLSHGRHFQTGKGGGSGGGSRRGGERIRSGQGRCEFGGEGCAFVDRSSDAGGADPADRGERRGKLGSETGVAVGGCTGFSGRVESDCVGASGRAGRLSQGRNGRV